MSTAEKIFNFNRINNFLHQTHILARLILRTMRQLDTSNISLEFECHTKTCEIMENHAYYLIRLIIEVFFIIKLHYYNKMFNLEIHTSFVRKQLTKTVHFNDQYNK